MDLSVTACTPNLYNGPDPEKEIQTGSSTNSDHINNQYRQPSIGRQLWALRNIIIVVFTPLILLPLPIITNDPKTHCAYVIVVMAVYWITEAVPIAVTSLIPVFLFPMIGLLEARTVSALYLNDTSLLLIGGLIVAVAIETSNFHRRLALGVLRLVGAEQIWLMAGLMGVTWFLSIWISNTATTAMMVPLAQAVLHQMKSSRHDVKNIYDSKMGGDREGNDGYETDGEVGKPPVVVKRESLDIRDGIVSTNEILTENKSSETKNTSSCEDAKYLRMYKAFSLSICYSANIGGIASLTGTAPNLVLRGQADIIFSDHNSTSPITFSNWLMYGFPLSLITVIILWIWMQAFFLRFKGFCSCFTGKKDDDANRRVKEVVQNEFKKLGPISFAQWCILILFGILVALWITRDLGEVGGWGNIFRPGFVSDSTPAIFIAFLLFVCPDTLPNVFCFRKPSDQTKPKVKPILQWKDVHEKMPWSLYLILGAGFSLARASKDSGLSVWLGSKLQVFSDLDPYLILLILCYIACFATEVTSNTAITTLMMPIVAQLAISFNINPLLFMFPTALTTSFAFMLPVATPPNAIVFSYGQVRVIDMVTCGFIMNIISVPIVILATATWGSAIYKFDTLPDGFILASTTSPSLNTTLAL